ncbi:MAG: ankyrin repeat domain-containing protein [Simkania negevensis]|nr:ankyrin repeat domain-containing protein [Simkania negevensis]
MLEHLCFCGLRKVYRLTSTFFRDILSGPIFLERLTMSILSPVCDAPCLSCEEFLSGPIISSNDPHRSNACKRYFEDMTQHSRTCPAFNSKIKSKTKNLKLEELAIKLDRLAKPLLARYSPEPFRNRLFHAAIREGEIDVVAFLITCGVSASSLLRGISPLYTACERGKIEIAQLLLENGALSTQKNDVSWRAKWNKYWHPDRTKDPKLEELIVKLKRLAKPILASYSPDPFRDRLFHAAINEGECDVVAFLIACGVSVSGLLEGISPLYTACKHGKIEIAQLLLENGALSTQKNDLSYQAKWSKYWHINDIVGLHGATPMKAAISSGSRDLVNLLIQYKAPFDEPGPDGRSPVFLAVFYRREDLALFFIENGANIKVRDYHGISLLSMTVRGGCLRVAQELVKRGVDIAEQDEDGSTALYDAAGGKNPELLAFLLQHGAAAVKNVLWLGKWTPISSAVSSGNVENVKLLVEAGADLSINYEGMDILELAKKELCKSESSLRENESFYRSHPQYREESERTIGNKRAVVEFLQKTMGRSGSKPVSNSPSIEESNMKAKKRIETLSKEIVTLSDGTKVHRAMVLQTALQVRDAVKGAGIGGEPFFLFDLKDKALKEDDWVPVPNPFCKSIEIMKANLLIDGRGHMLPDIKSIIRDCIVSDEVGNLKLQIPQ